MLPIKISCGTLENSGCRLNWWRTLLFLSVWILVLASTSLNEVGGIKGFYLMLQYMIKLLLEEIEFS